MTPENKKNKRLVALFLFGFVLLNLKTKKTSGWLLYFYSALSC